METINLGAERPTGTFQVIDMICALMSTDYIDIIKSPMWNGELVNQHIMEGKAKQLIDWCPEISLTVGLPATVRWYEAYLKRMKHDE